MSSGAHLVLACKSELAFLPMRGSTVVEIALDRVSKSKSISSISVWIPNHLLPHAPTDLLRRLSSHGLDAESTLLEHVRRQVADVVLVHDAQRPLTLPATVDEVAQSVTAQATRVCPAHIVVDTLKVINTESVIIDTVDRSKVQTLSSPEGYWRESITDQIDQAWHFAVADGDVSFVQGTTEATRIRAAEDVLLVEAFLVWQTASKNR